MVKPTGTSYVADVAVLIALKELLFSESYNKDNGDLSRIIADLRELITNRFTKKINLYF